MHGLPEWTQVSIFYNSVNTPTRMMLDASANGTLLDKPPRKGLEILEKLALNNYQHPTTLKNMLKQPTIQEAKAIDLFCEICGNNHDTSECGQHPESSSYVGNFNRNAMTNTYNPSWKKHPNFSWQNLNNTLNPNTSNQQEYQSQPRQNQELNQPRQEYQQPSNYNILENTLNTFMTQTSTYMARTNQFIQKTDSFMDRTEMGMQNQEATLKSLENQVGQISQVLKSRPIGGFPSDTEVAKGAIHEQCKAISTRSGKVLKTPPKSKQGEITVTNSKVTSDTDIPAQADIPAEVEKDHTDPPTIEEAETAAETPQRLKKQKQEYQFKKFFEILKQVHINMPLVEALQ
ncbi:hypothetical protein V6N11_058343 [Hibiscus sabdariffa]|uniref:Uncharacterized protein n=1 Tax=Hibiscus sabdariffa TaxID=183260 RepID=A0ABR2U413_9ROSI